jgi:hypothetical protein
LENTMTVAEMLDALYDGIGSTWVTGKSFVEEVAAWVETVTEPEEDRDDDGATPLPGDCRS